MKKSYTVKNATFIFDDEVRFGKKSFDYNPETYDKWEATEEFANIGDDMLRPRRRLMMGIIISVILVFFIPIGGFANPWKLPVSENTILTVCIIVAILWFIAYIVSFMMFFNRGNDIDRFLRQASPIKVITQYVKNADNVKEFTITGYDEDDQRVILGVEFEDDTLSTFEDFIKGYEFDPATYDKHGNIEINVIDKTVRGV